MTVKNIKKPKQGDLRVTILKNASKLFWKKGYHNAGMRDIALVCGFEAANLYHYYSSKEEILYEVLLAELTHIISKIKLLAEDETVSPVERLRASIQIQVDFVLSHQFPSSRWLFDLGLLYLNPAHKKKIIEIRDSFDNMIRKIILDGINTGDFDQVNPKLAEFAVMAIIARTRIWYSPKGPLSSDEVADFIFDFALHGLTGRK